MEIHRHLGTSCFFSLDLLIFAVLAIFPVHFCTWLLILISDGPASLYCILISYTLLEHIGWTPLIPHSPMLWQPTSNGSEVAGSIRQNCGGWQHTTKLWPTIKISIQVSWLLEAGGVKLACLVILLSFKVRLGSFIEAAIVDLTEIQCPTQRLK